MRVRFDADPIQSEIGLQLATMRATTEFWRVVEDCLFKGSGLAHARRALLLIDSDLDLERVDTRTLAVRDLGDGGATPIAERVVDAAPGSLGLKVITERAPLPVTQALKTVAERTGVDLSGSRIRVGVGRGHLLEVVVRTAEASSGDDERARASAQLFCTLCLGDQVFRHWVGSVDVEPAPKPSPLRVLPTDSKRSAEWLDVGELVATVDVARQRVLESVGGVPCHRRCEAADWVLFELESEDVGAVERVAAQQDLLLATTMVPEAWRCFLQGDPFSSQRFSSVGEQFAFVKYQLEGANEARVALRTHLEDAINYRLVPADLGCVVGGGLGTHYCYLLLALQDLGRSLKVLVKTLRENDVPRRSWIQFCDDVLQREWVAVWPEAGPPPGM